MIQPLFFWYFSSDTVNILSGNLYSYKKILPMFLKKINMVDFRFEARKKWADDTPILNFLNTGFC